MVVTPRSVSYEHEDAPSGLLTVSPKAEVTQLTVPS